MIARILKKDDGTPVAISIGVREPVHPKQAEFLASLIEQVEDYYAQAKADLNGYGNVSKDDANPEEHCPNDGSG